MNPSCSAPSPATVPQPSRFPWAGWLAGAAILFVLVVAGRRLGTWLPAAAAWIDGLDALGPLAFVSIYGVAMAAFVPATLLTLAGGALFGVLEGTLYCFAGAVLGSTLGFLISRYVARGAVQRRFGHDRRVRAIDRAITADARRIVFLLRLSPLFPFGVLNYALGVTTVNFTDYLVASTGMLPGTVLYVWYGALASHAAAAAAGVSTRKTPLDYGVLAVGVAATILASVYAARAARRALTVRGGI